MHTVCHTGLRLGYYSIRRWLVLGVVVVASGGATIRAMMALPRRGHLAPAAADHPNNRGSIHLHMQARVLEAQSVSIARREGCIVPRVPRLPRLPMRFDISFSCPSLTQLTSATHSTQTLASATRARPTAINKSNTPRPDPPVALT